jgi:hypothetical protein
VEVAVEAHVQAVAEAVTPAVAAVTVKPSHHARSRRAED